LDLSSQIRDEPLVLFLEDEFCLAEVLFRLSCVTKLLLLHAFRLTDFDTYHGFDIMKGK
jgi:hypothetical protein